MKVHIGVLTAFIFVLQGILPKPMLAIESDRFWDIQSIDTMKYSRDRARDTTALANIPDWIDSISSLNPTHIAIGTPYDEEFVPVITAWSDEIHKHGKKVWFRGNFSSWEGWFNYPKYTNLNQHHQQLRMFILSHPDLFQEGDIFTPAPEAENGVIGDPRQSPEKAKIFRQFLMDSYQVCVTSFKQIQKNVHCGYFSTNGDVAEQILDRYTVERIGGTVVIDHYVKDPVDFGNDIEIFYQQFGFPIVLGEIGAPIPDLHGNLDEAEQAKLIDAFLLQTYEKRAFISGLNYWIFAGGESALFNDNNTPRLAASVITKYYQPAQVTGRVFNTAGDTLAGSIVYSTSTISADATGEYQALIPAGEQYLTATKDGYIAATTRFYSSPGTSQIQDFILEPLQPDSWYQLRLTLKNLRRLFFS